MDPITIVLSVIQDAPAIVAAVKAALQKQGWTNEEIDAVFALVLPYEQLGIDPLHPVAPEPAAKLVPLVQSVPAPGNPFERAR